MLSINIITYIFIQIWDNLNGEKFLTTWQKRLMMLLATIINIISYKLVHYDNDIILLNSTIAAPVFWSWVLKPILTKFGIGYKKVDDCLS
jgi:hypothetical protein